MLVCFRYRHVNHIYMFIMYTDMQQFSLGNPVNNLQKKTTQCTTTTTSQIISTTYLCIKKKNTTEKITRNQVQSVIHIDRTMHIDLL